MEIRPVGVDRSLAQPFQRLRRRVAVIVVGARRDDGDAGAQGVQQRRGRGGSRAVVGDLEDVDGREAPREERRIHVLLDVAREQEPQPAGLAEQHDRGVVDALAIGWRPGRDGSGIRPQDAEADPVERQSVAGREPAAWRSARLEHGQPGLVAGTAAGQPGFVDVPHPVSLHDQRQAGDVVLVRMAEHDDVDPAIPGRQSLVERLQEAGGIGPAVDHHPPAATALDQDRVALPDVQQRDRREPRWSVGDDQRQPEHGGDEARNGDAWQSGAAARACVGPPPRHCAGPRGTRARLARTGSRS